MPRSRITAGWTSRAYGPNAAPVPTAPDILPTTTRGDACRSRSPWRAVPEAETPLFSPDGIGAAACPWGRPRLSGRLCLDPQHATKPLTPPLRGSVDAEPRLE